MYDNEIYALTKSQTSPTTRKGHATNTQPQGTYLEPLNVMRLVLGIGGSFVASTAGWMPDHLERTIQMAFKHKGFSFVHILQRCPHFDPDNFDHKSSSWFSFLNHEKGIAPDKRLLDKTRIIEHDPANLDQAFKLAVDEHRYFGLFYHNPDRPCYDEILHNQLKNTAQKPRFKIFDNYKI